MTGGQLIRIGRIPYANLFPIFFVLERDMDCSDYEFVEGMPSELNRMLREGALDLSPSSSIEYIRDPARYAIIDGHSVSAQGPVGSVFLFSERPIEQLNGTAVAVTSHSETSVALLRIITEKFLGISCTLDVSDRPLESRRPACLLIGDEAIRRRTELVIRGEGAHLLPGGAAAGPLTHIYDLGEIWHRQTGLPFVFALWIVRKELLGPGRSAAEGKAALFEKFVRDLGRAKETALRERPLIARHSPLRAFLSEGEILSYWDKLDYDLEPTHRRGLALFGEYLREVTPFLPSEPDGTGR
jgi:chorismate dehydratase